MYRLNDIMIHDNDNCTDACGTATVLNCNIRKWRLNATALSLRRKFFMGEAFLKIQKYRTPYVQVASVVPRHVICKLSATLCICGKCKTNKMSRTEKTDFLISSLLKRKKKQFFHPIRFFSQLRNDLRTVH